MISMKRLLGSAAVLTLAANAHAVTLFGTYSTYQSDSLGAPETLISSGAIDSGEFDFTALSGDGQVGAADLTVVFTDVTYATQDNSGNPFPPGTEPLYLSSIEVGFVGTAFNDALVGIGTTSNTVVACVDIDPGACASGPAGSTANDVIGLSLVSASNPGWEVGTVLDFSAGVTVSSVLDLTGFDGDVFRFEFTLYDSIVITDPDFSEVPVPAAVWFFGSGLMGLVALNRRRNSKN